MKTSISVLCSLFACVSINCGGQPIDAPPSTEPGAPASEQSEMVKLISSTANPDGTYTQKEYYQTREEYRATIAERKEMLQLHKQGIDPTPGLAKAPSEIEVGNCSIWNSTWIWSQAGGEGTPCCLVGDAGNYVNNMCPFTYIRTVWGGRLGMYIDHDETCLTYFEYNEWIGDTHCNANWIQHQPE